MYKLYKRATSRDGLLEADSRPYGMNQEFLNEFGPEIADKGCATCIFVKLDGGPANEVMFETTGGYEEPHAVRADRWAQSSMYNPGSGYNPANLKGPWIVSAIGAPSEKVDDIGLPAGEHVTHFVVLRWEEGAEIPEEEDDEGPDPVDPPGESLADYPIEIGFSVDGKSYEGWVRQVNA